MSGHWTEKQRPRRIIIFSTNRFFKRRADSEVQQISRFELRIFCKIIIFKCRQLDVLREHFLGLDWLQIQLIWVLLGGQINNGAKARWCK